MWEGVHENERHEETSEVARSKIEVLLINSKDTYNGDYHELCRAKFQSKLLASTTAVILIGRATRGVCK
jgi:hypothetical protein